jgi:hypothetical protein
MYTMSGGRIPTPESAAFRFSREQAPSTGLRGRGHAEAVRYDFFARFFARFFAGRFLYPVLRAFAFFLTTFFFSLVDGTGVTASPCRCFVKTRTNSHRHHGNDCRANAAADAKAVMRSLLRPLLGAPLCRLFRFLGTLFQFSRWTIYHHGGLLQLIRRFA